MNAKKVYVDSVISRLDEILFHIKRADDLINQIPEKAARIPYEKQLQEMLSNYKEVCHELKFILKDYKEYENKNKLPINLAYRRLYKKLSEF